MCHSGGIWRVCQIGCAELIIQTGHNLTVPPFPSYLSPSIAQSSSIPQNVGQCTVANTGSSNTSTFKLRSIGAYEYSGNSRLPPPACSKFHHYPENSPRGWLFKPNPSGTGGLSLRPFFAADSNGFIRTMWDCSFHDAYGSSPLIPYLWYGIKTIISQYWDPTLREPFIPMPTTTMTTAGTGMGMEPLWDSSSTMRPLTDAQKQYVWNAYNAAAGSIGAAIQDDECWGLLRTICVHPPTLLLHTDDMVGSCPTCQAGN